MSSAEDVGRPGSAPLGLSLRARDLPLAGGWGLEVAEIVADAWLWATPADLRVLERLRRDVPIHLHALGLNLGSVDGLDPEYVDRLRTLAQRLEVTVVSDHFAWRSIDGEWSSTFLPIPLHPEVLAHVADRVEAVQDRLGGLLALETPTLYTPPLEAGFDLADALLALHERAGTEVLVDVCNLRVSAHNVGLNPEDLVRRLAPATAYVHVAGFSRGAHLCLDDHGSSPEPETMRLAGLSDAPVILEWDRNPPPPSAMPSVLETLRRSPLPPPRVDPPRIQETRPSPNFSDLETWCRTFRAEVEIEATPGHRALRAEQIFTALAFLEESHPRTQATLGEGFRWFVREHASTSWARDVHGLDRARTFSGFLRQRPELQAHPARKEMEAEWAQYE